MASRLFAAALALCAAQCAFLPSAPDAFAFAVMGDTPYSDAEEERFLGRELIGIQFGKRIEGGMGLRGLGRRSGRCEEVGMR